VPTPVPNANIATAIDRAAARRVVRGRALIPRRIMVVLSKVNTFQFKNKKKFHKHL
jgi:hypothetical protein